jgi:hypothetical protein
MVSLCLNEVEASEGEITMQQKIGGIALKAEDVKLDNLDLPETITIGEVKEIVDHLHSDPVSPQTDKY